MVTTVSTSEILELCALPADMWSYTNQADEFSRELIKEVTTYAESNYDTWESLFVVWLFQLRTSVKHGNSPFSAMFNRDPIATNLDGNQQPDTNDTCDNYENVLEDPDHFPPPSLIRYEMSSSGDMDNLFS